MLTSLIRTFKPALVLETGTFNGDALELLALACRRNGFGRVISIEHAANLADVARKRFAGWPEVEVVHGDSVAYLRSYKGEPFGFAFLDSDLQARVEELRILRDRKLCAGPVLVHDTSRLRAATYPDWAGFPDALDSLGLSDIECGGARGWRLFSFA